MFPISDLATATPQYALGVTRRRQSGPGGGAREEFAMKSRIVRLLDEQGLVLLSRIQDLADATAIEHRPIAANIRVSGKRFDLAFGSSS